MEISKELLSEVLDVHILKHSCNGYNLYYDYFKEGITYTSYNMTIYELIYLKLKQWSKLNKFFDKIDWSKEPEEIIMKAGELRK